MLPIEDTDSDPQARPQSQAAILAYLKQWHVLTSLNYPELTPEHLHASYFRPLRAYLAANGLNTLVRTFWDDSFNKGELCFIYDTDTYTYDEAVRACERILFAKYGYSFWTDADEQRAEWVRQRKARQRAARLAKRQKP